MASSEATTSSKPGRHGDYTTRALACRSSIHSHVDVDELAENERYTDIWQVEGAIDYYVRSMMRKRGVPEPENTGDASNREKCEAMPKYSRRSPAIRLASGSTSISNAASTLRGATEGRTTTGER